MNKKTRLFVLSLLSFALAPVLHAQTPGEDFTTRITNPGFEGTYTSLPLGANTSQNHQPDGWTITTVWANWRDISINTATEAKPSSDGTQYYNIWMGNVTSIDLRQKITLPVGKYKLTAAMRMTDANPEYITNQHIFASLADGITYQSNILSEKGVGKVIGQEENSEGELVDIVDCKSWDTLAVVFNVPKEQNIIIGAASESNLGNAAGWFQIDDYKLTYIGEPGDIDINDIISAISAKTALANNNTLYNDGIMPQGTYYAMLSAIDKASDVNQNTPLAEAQSALEELTNAINDADEGKLLFDTLNIYIFKAGEVPNTYPGYAEFAIILDDASIVLGDGASTNVEFKASLAELKDAYKQINLNYMNSATAEDGKDATWLIENPKFTKLGGNAADAAEASKDNWTSSWVYNGTGDQWIGQGLVLSGATDDEKVNAYEYNGWNYTNIELTQQLGQLPEGAYTLSCNFHTKSTPGSMWVYAKGSYEEQKKSPSYMYSADADPATPWWETVTTEKVYVGKEGTLKIGYYCQQPGGSSYCGVNLTDWKLTYYGKEGGADQLVAQLLEEAKALRDSVEIEHMIMPVERAELLQAIQEGDEAVDKSTVIETLQTAIADTKECVSMYASVGEMFEAAETYLQEGQDRGEEKDVTEFINVINAQTLLLEQPTTSRFTLASVEETLKEACRVFQFKLTAVASENKPVDVTLAIANPTIETTDNKKAPEGWTCSLSSNSNGNYSGNGQYYTGDGSNHYLDAYSDVEGGLLYTAKQTVIVPNGTYILKCAGRASGEGVYLFAKGKTLYTQEITVNGDMGGSIWENAETGSDINNANGSQGYGWNWITLPGIETETRSLEIGVTCDPAVSEGKAFTGKWFSADDFTLLCTKGEGYSAIEDVTTDNGQIASVYVENGYVKVNGSDDFQIFTISSIQIPNNTQLAPGFYIVRVNGVSVTISVQ